MIWINDNLELLGLVISILISISVVHSSANGPFTLSKASNLSLTTSGSLSLIVEITRRPNSAATAFTGYPREIFHLPQQEVVLLATPSISQTVFAYLPSVSALGSGITPVVAHFAKHCTTRNGISVACADTSAHAPTRVSFCLLVHLLLPVTPKISFEVNSALFSCAL